MVVALLQKLTMKVVTHTVVNPPQRPVIAVVDPQVNRRRHHRLSQRLVLDLFDVCPNADIVSSMILCQKGQVHSVAEVTSKSSRNLV